MAIPHDAAGNCYLWRISVAMLTSQPERERKMVRAAALLLLGLGATLYSAGLCLAQGAAGTQAQQTHASPPVQAPRQMPPQAPALPPAPFPAPVSPEETQSSPPPATPSAANPPPVQTGQVNQNPASDDSRVNKASPLLLKHLAQDQVSIWTSPARIRTDQTVWLVPLAGITAGFLVTDKEASGHLNSSPSTISRYKDISDYAAYSMAAGAAGLYFLGNITHDEHERETGFLSGEAALDSLAVTEALKFATGRQRPYQDSGNGGFWQGGTSFPSEHAAAAWSIAGIVAHEYPGTLTKLLAYGLAGVVSAGRVEGKQHFPSDALVGSAIGYLVSNHVYNTRHDPKVGGGEWSGFPIHSSEDGQWQGRDMGSPYVPMDSWIYPAFDRLEAMGYANTGFLGMRPWARRECARLLSEMSDKIVSDDRVSNEAYQIYSTLEDEFADDIALLGGGKNRRLQLESVYTRSTEIAGKPLTDGYNFGQTIINDFGRPYQQGFNNVTGASAWATEGPWVAYVRWEYQHAPSSPSLPDSVLQLIPSLQGGLPCCPLTTATSTVNRGRLLDAYAGLNVHDWQITFGQQTEWWGPEDGGPMAFSDNVEPIPMFRINRITPFKLPWLLGLMGPMRVELFLGQVGGQHWLFGPQGFVGGYTTFLNPQPFIHGEKFSFKPTENFEISFGRTVFFSGQTIPFTLGLLRNSYFSINNHQPITSIADPGDRSSFLDFTYRLPGLRRWAEFYADGFTEDQFSPIAYWDRAAWDTGIYFSHLPGVPKMDFRAEGVFTDLAINFGPGVFYADESYHSGDTNFGNIIGSWVGRQGTGVQAWTNYWFTPRRRVQLNFRHLKVSQQFIPLGGTLTDAGVNIDWLVSRHLSVTSAVQYEKWLFPVIFASAQTNITGSMQLTLWPGSWGKWPK
jgi:hypothetical protein